MSLRRRLSALVAIALVPSLLLAAYNAARWKIFLEDEANTTALSTARFVSAEFELIIDNSRQLMTAMAKYPNISEHEEECRSYFKSVIQDIPIYREAAIIDTDGKFHCSTIPIPPTLNVKDRIYFYEPLKTGKLADARITQVRFTHSPSIHLSMPSKAADGSIRGVIVLTLNPEKLAEILPAYPWRSEQRLIVLDREGSLVLTIPPSDFENVEAISKSIFPKIDHAPAGTMDIKGPNSRSEIIGFAPLHDASEGLFTAVAIDRDSALTGSIINVQSIAFNLIALILAVIGVWLAAYF